MKQLFVILLMLLAINASAQWVQMSTGIGTTQAINCLTVNGNNIFAGTGNSGIYRSTNNGETWSRCFNSGFIRSIYATTNYIVAYKNPFADSSVVIRSTDNGTTWSQTDLTEFVYTFAKLGNILFAGTNTRGIYISTNNGINWSRSINSVMNSTVFSLVTAGNILFAGANNGVHISTNNGIDWTLTSMNDYIISLAYGGTDIYAGTMTNHGVYFSSNYGANWIQAGLVNHYQIHSLAAIDSNVFAGDINGVFYSTNRGVIWLIRNLGFNIIPTVKVLLIANGYIFAGTSSQSIWRRSLSEITVVQNISTEKPSIYSLSQNYPNPFNNTSKLKFEIANLGDVKLIVYDVMGREVQTLVNEELQPGRYESMFDGSKLNSGVYFYKLTVRHGGSPTNEFTETKRMLLIK